MRILLARYGSFIRDYISHAGIPTVGCYRICVYILKVCIASIFYYFSSYLCIVWYVLNKTSLPLILAHWFVVTPTIFVKSLRHISKQTLTRCPVDMKSRAPTGSCMLLTHSVGAIALLSLTAELIHGSRDFIQIAKLNQKKTCTFFQSQRLNAF